MKDTKEFSEGMEAYHMGKNWQKDCPYSSIAQEQKAKDWQRGWLFADFCEKEESE